MMAPQSGKRFDRQIRLGIGRALILTGVVSSAGCSSSDSGGGATEVGGAGGSSNVTTGGKAGAVTSQPGQGGKSTSPSGGSMSLGGQGTTTPSGGTGASAGSTAATGGTANGGSALGGATANGGSTSIGGATSKGGTNATGGTTAKGGTTAIGGTTATGGLSSTGGTTSKGGTTATGGSVTLTPNITIDTATKYQTIDGFGAALPMWGGSNNMWTTDEVRKFVGMGATELGGTIIRTIVDPDKNRWSYAVANLKEAKSYGSDVKVLATPWTPPASMKKNNSTTCAGITSSSDTNCRLKTDSYAAYATHLNDYVTYMSGQGVAIDVLSIQNEPDWPTDYESCLWSGTEFLNFVKNNASAIKGTKLMIPESLQFTRSYSDPTLNDATAVNNISYIGGHLYGAEAGGKLSEYALANQKGKPQWMTEWNFHEADGSGAAIWGGDNQTVWNESLDVVMRSVHLSMAAKWSAYIWWWGRRYYSFIGDGESAFGTTKGAILKRGWAFSHYSKFVRPGYTRVAATMNTAYSNVLLTAYDGDSKVVIVLLNRATSPYSNVVIKIPSNVSAAEAWVTSQSTNRTALTATPAGQYATIASLPARSIVTVVMSY